MIAKGGLYRLMLLFPAHGDRAIRQVRTSNRRFAFMVLMGRNDPVARQYRLTPSLSAAIQQETIFTLDRASCVILSMEETKMAETVLMQPRRKSIAGYKSAAHELLAAMNRLDEQIDRDHATAERLKDSRNNNLCRKDRNSISSAI